MAEQRVLNEQDIIYVIECAEGLHKNLDKFAELLNLSLPQSMQDVPEQTSNEAPLLPDSYCITVLAKNEILSRFGDWCNEHFFLQSEHFDLDASLLVSELFRLGISCQNIKLLELLLKCGFNDRRRLWDGLQLAVETENLDVVRIVIEFYVPMNVSDPEREIRKTALGIAIEKRNLDLVKLLLDSGCDTEIRDGVRDNETALMLATDQGWREGWELLLKYGAKPLPENCFIEYLPLMTAIRTLKEDCVDAIMTLLNKTLSACSNDLQREKISSAALGVAVFCSYFNIVKYLLDQNVSPDRVLLSERLKGEEFERRTWWRYFEPRGPFGYLDAIMHLLDKHDTVFKSESATHNNLEYLYAPALWIIRYLTHEKMTKMRKLLLNYRANPDIFLDCFGGGSMLTTAIFMKGSMESRKIDLCYEFTVEMLLSNADASRRTWCTMIEPRLFLFHMYFVKAENIKAFIRALLANGLERNDGLGYFMSRIIERAPFLEGDFDCRSDGGRMTFQLFTDITKVITEMPRLVDLCRAVIRQKLRQSNRPISVESQVSILPIPNKLKGFLLLEDLGLNK